MSAEIRKIAVWVEETHREIGQVISPATRKAVAVAVIKNPFAGSYTDDLTPLMDIGAELGGLLGDKCVAALGIEPAQAESYGKAAMVGE
ncbi:MAG: amino acid synthesis family protein, partial [Sulfitobacter sp.]|nr:amino acid synthesis family protein [Sulfitobacter sp.]